MIDILIDLTFFYGFERSLLCSPRLDLFDQTVLYFNTFQIQSHDPLAIFLNLMLKENIIVSQLKKVVLLNNFVETDFSPRIFWWIESSKP